MKSLKLEKENKKSILVICVIIFSYAAERIIELFVPQSRELGIILAMVYTLLLMFTVLALYKSEDSCWGLLAALFAYKMMPVSISFLFSYSQSAALLYFIVQKAGALMFMGIIYKLYCAQDKNRKVSALTVLSIMLAVPFFAEIASVLTQYFLARTGSMLGGYMSQFAVYAFATFIILILSYCSSLHSLRFAAAYETVALSINILKYGAKIGYRILNSWHISRSFYVWIALYFILIMCFALAVKIKTQKEAKEA